MTLSAAIERLVDGGLDLTRTFDVAQYNELIAEHETLTPLPMFGREHALGLLVGNTRALWPHLLEACRRGIGEDPVDGYVAQAVEVSARAIEPRHAIYLAHERGARLVSMLHAAQASGLTVGPVHLAIDAEHGPWFALRAVVVVDAAPETVARVDVCRGCDQPCRPAFERALAQGDSDGPAWQAWVAVRDACPIGRASRYTEDQIAYHYTKDRSLLQPQ